MFLSIPAALIHLLRLIYVINRGSIDTFAKVDICDSEALIHLLSLIYVINRGSNDTFTKLDVCD